MATGLLGITGATGHIGGHLTRLLSQEGIGQRLMVRDSARVSELADIEVVQASYEDADSVRAALDGISTVWMVSLHESPQRVDIQCGFVDAAVAAGVSHIVYLSFVGAKPDAKFTLARDHWATEQHIRSNGTAFTFLRDNLYADFMSEMVGEDGVIGGPAGEGRAAVVARRDIAEVSKVVLSDPASHAGKIYDLTGPEALSMAEIAAVVSEVTGKKVTYENQSIEDAFSLRSLFKVPDCQVRAWVSTYTAIAAGDMAQVSSAVEDLTGHPATALIQVLQGR